MINVLGLSVALSWTEPQESQTCRMAQAILRHEARSASRRVRSDEEEARAVCLKATEDRLFRQRKAREADPRWLAKLFSKVRNQDGN